MCHTVYATGSMLRERSRIALSQPAKSPQVIHNRWDKIPGSIWPSNTQWLQLVLHTLLMRLETLIESTKQSPLHCGS